MKEKELTKGGICRSERKVKEKEFRMGGIEKVREERGRKSSGWKDFEGAREK